MAQRRPSRAFESISLTELSPSSSARTLWYVDLSLLSLRRISMLPMLTVIAPGIGSIFVHLPWGMPPVIVQ